MFLNLLSIVMMIIENRSYNFVLVNYIDIHKRIIWLACFESHLCIAYPYLLICVLKKLKQKRIISQKEHKTKFSKFPS